MKPILPPPMKKTPWNRAKSARFLIAFGLLAMLVDGAFYAGRDAKVVDLNITPYLLVAAAAALAVLAGVILIASTPEEHPRDS